MCRRSCTLQHHQSGCSPGVLAAIFGRMDASRLTFLATVPLLALVVCGCSAQVADAEAASASGEAASGADGGQGGVSGCQGAIDVSVNGGTTLHWTSVCAGNWGAAFSSTPVAYGFGNGTPQWGIFGFAICGCAGSNPYPRSPGVFIFGADPLATGNYLSVALGYIDDDGNEWGNGEDGITPSDVVLTNVGQVGGSVEGTFWAIVTFGGEEEMVDGEFHVCRVPDDEQGPSVP
jgi:hypothetical protein